MWAVLGCQVHLLLQMMHVMATCCFQCITTPRFFLLHVLVCHNLQGVFTDRLGYQTLVPGTTVFDGTRIPNDADPSCGLLYGPAGGPFWFRFTAPNSGVYQIDTCAGDVDTYIMVYDDTSCYAPLLSADQNQRACLPFIAANDDTEGCGSDGGSLVQFDAVAGQKNITYWWQGLMVVPTDQILSIRQEFLMQQRPLDPR